ncbi:MAG: hypothetical protein IJU52_03860 [Clostridia bacterium]|nr:hypothetical protein [Clostridia bacterium]
MIGPYMKRTAAFCALVALAFACVSCSLIADTVDGLIGAPSGPQSARKTPEETLQTPLPPTAGGAPSFLTPAPETPMPGLSSTGTPAPDTPTPGLSSTGTLAPDTPAPDPTVPSGPTGTDATDLPFEPGYGEPVYIDKNALPVYQYWRNTLKTDAQRLAYDSICDMHKKKETSATFGVPVTYDEIVTVYKVFRLDHPEFFESPSDYLCKGTESAIRSIEMTPLYTPEEIARMQEEIDGAAARILEGIPDGATDFEAEEYIYTWLSSHVVYDLSAPHLRDLYGALVDRRCVCEGFAEAFQYLMLKVGVPAISVSGTAEQEGRTPERHKWNAALIGGQWYPVDVTWAASSGYVRPIFLNNAEMMSATHAPDEELLSDLPAFSAAAACVLDYYGLVFDAENFGEVLMRAFAFYEGRFGDGDASAFFIKSYDRPAAEEAIKKLNGDDAQITALLERYREMTGARLALYDEAVFVSENTIRCWICRY